MTFLVRLSPIWASVFCWIAGCGAREEVVSYRVPKEHLLSEDNAKALERERSGKSDGMWGAIVLRPGKGWFFKASGRAEDVAAARTELKSFLAGVSYNSDNQPEWKLPTKWQQLPGTGMRYATLKMAATQRVEISVTSLPFSDVEPAKYLLENVNRWRNQLGLPKLLAADLESQSERVKISGDGEALVVYMEGVASASMGPGNSAAPFAGTAPAESGAGKALPEGHPEIREKAVPAATSEGGEIAFTPPAHWKRMPARAFGKAAFVVGEGDSRLEITISELSTMAASAGELLPNVNRWRGQLGLNPVDEGALAEIAKPIEVGSHPGQLVEIVGAADVGAAKPAAMYVAMAVVGSKVWFVKLLGPQTLAEQERESFQKFIATIRFGGEAGGKP